MDINKYTRTSCLLVIGIYIYLKNMLICNIEKLNNNKIKIQLRLIIEIVEVFQLWVAGRW